MFVRAVAVTEYTYLKILYEPKMNPIVRPTPVPIIAPILKCQSGQLIVIRWFSCSKSHPTVACVHVARQSFEFVWKNKRGTNSRFFHTLGSFRCGTCCRDIVRLLWDQSVGREVVGWVRGKVRYESKKNSPGKLKFTPGKQLQSTNKSSLSLGKQKW